MIGLPFVEGTYDIGGSWTFYCDCVNGPLTEFGNDQVIVQPQPSQLQGPTSLSRGQSGTFQVINQGMNSITNWQFVPSDSSLPTIDRSSGAGSATWSGPIVASGTVRVTVGGQTLTRSVQIQARDLTTPTVDPQQVSIGAPSGACQSAVFNLPVPVANGHGTMGAFCLEQLGQVIMNTVPDGPNTGVKWVESMASGNALRWLYRWVVHPHIDNLNCGFSLQQTGTFHPVNNPNGLISGANLRANVIRHESGSSASHYAQFAAANANSSNNPGAGVEGMLAAPSVQLSAFVNQVNQELASRRDAIGSATTNPEPPGGDRDAGGNFQGFINFGPYSPANCNP
jgi:hypothetical protein